MGSCVSPCGLTLKNITGPTQQIRHVAGMRLRSTIHEVQINVWQVSMTGMFQAKKEVADMTM